MTKDEAVKFYGSQAALAAALEVTQPTVAGWKAIPFIHQIRLDRITQRKLTADPKAWGPAK